MRSWHSLLTVVAATLLLAALEAAPARAFILSTQGPAPWLSTASGSRTGNGDPATLTWSLVPDGTQTTDDTGVSAGPSDLVSFMNANFGGNPAQTDLTLQPWFHLFAEPFDRWSELSGVNYVYEPHDDGVAHPSAGGQLGVRGDVRIAGLGLDGASGTLAFTYIPAGGSDMVVDTDDGAFFQDPTNNYRGFRNTIMHEIGHSFGLLHVSSSSNLLMEPIIDTTFDGPQLDEVRGVQYFFGDANEKSHGGAGNDTAANATQLGLIAGGSTISVGASADIAGQAISGTVKDFVSITGGADADFYSFSVGQASLLNAALVPRGGVFTQASSGQTPTTFDANSRNDLALSIFAGNGTTVLATANLGAAGVTESLANLHLGAGTYFARITGATTTDTVQLYQLSLSASAILQGDFDENGVVDAADLAAWKGSFGLATGALHSQGDANGDGAVDGMDLLIWQRERGSGAPTVGAVPEPNAATLAGLATTLIVWRKRRARDNVSLARGRNPFFALG